MIEKHFLRNLFIFLFFIAASCATLQKAQIQWSSLSSVDQAAKVDQLLLQTLSSFKDSIQQQYEIYKQSNNEQGLSYIQNQLSPLVSKAEESISAYHFSVIQWLSTETRPTDLEMKLQLASLALDQLEKAILDLTIGASK
jgi:hypothetical protein